MDLSKVPNDKKLSLCRWYFRAGWALLPFIWTVNAIWFFNEAFKKPEYEEQKQIKRYVIMSALGSFVWFVLLVSWITTFQLSRPIWGELADKISFIIPLDVIVSEIGCFCSVLLIIWMTTFELSHSILVYWRQNIT